MPLVFGDKMLGEGIHPSRNMSHTVYGCWDAYMSMQMIRKDAIARWERIESLHDRIEANPGHPSNEKAKERIDMLEREVLQLQSDFLVHEQYANSYWRIMTIKQREADAVHEMFGVESDAPDILGNWNRNLGSAEGAPKKFRINPVALQFAPPSVAQAYIKGVR